MASICAFAQEPVETLAPAYSGQVVSPTNLTSLSGEFFNHDFFNVYAFINGLHDSNVQQVGGATSPSWGYSLGGGIDAYHNFQTGELSLTYRGDYRDYGSNAYESGSDQNLAFLYSQRLGPRWTLATNINAGQTFYGSQYYSYGNAGPITPIANPFSSETRFLQGGISVTYEKTARLSYSFRGNGFLTRYSFQPSFGSSGGIGAASVSYRLNRRSTVSGTYSHTTFIYQHNVGTSQIDSVFLTLTHTFSDRTSVSISGGASHTHIQGDFSSQLGNESIPGFVAGPYNETSWVPSFEATVAHNWRQVEFSASAGQTVAPGNGVYLTSRSDFVSGTASRSWRKLNLSAGGGYFHITSVSNAVSGSYNTASLAASVGYMLMRYLGVHFSYNYFLYGNFGNFNNVNDNRITFGFSFSSKSIPMTLF